MARFLFGSQPNPLSNSCEEKRSFDRYRRILLTAASGAVTRAITLATGVISVPLLLSYLGPDLYGMWLTATSILTAMWLADLGLGQGLVNQLATARGKDDQDSAQTVVSSGFFALFSLATLVGGLFVLVYPLVPWDRVLNVQSDKAIRYAAPTVLAVFICWLGDWVTKIVQRINDGRQAGYRNNLWNAVGRAAAIALLLAAVYRNASPPQLVFALAGVPLVANLVNGFLLFRLEPQLRPRIDKVSRSATVGLFRSGFGFLGLDASYLVIMNGSLLIIAHFQGAAMVPNYAVPAKLFALVNLLISLITTPFWPAYSESLASGDFTWVRRAWLRSFRLSFWVSLIPSVLLIFFGEQLLLLWVGESVTVTPLILVGFGAWNVVFALGNTAGVFLNGTGDVRISAMTQGAQAIVFVVAASILSREFGVGGVVWSLVLTDLVLRTAPRVLFVRSRLRGCHPILPSRKDLSAEDSES